MVYCPTEQTDSRNAILKGDYTMLTLIDGGKKTLLRGVCSHTDPAFRTCLYWLVVFSEDTYTIYGLLFKPYEIVAADIVSTGVIERYEYVSNKQILDIVAVLAPEWYDEWQIVEPTTPR